MKRVVVSSFIFLAILALIYAGYFMVQRFSIIAAHPKNAIPSGTIFFLETKNTRNLFRQLSSENLLEPLLDSDSSLRNRTTLLDSLLSSSDELNNILEENTVYISAHLTKARSIDYLFLTNVSSYWTNDKAEHFISKTFQLKTQATNRVYENVSVREIRVSPGKIFSFAITKGIFIGSFTSFLIDESIRQLKSGASVSNSKAFSKISKSVAVQKTSLYINYISLGEFFSSYSNSGNTGVFNFIRFFARWTKLDAVIQNTGLIFHGFTASLDTSDFVTSLGWQEPQKIKMTELFPLRTALFIHLGFSNYPNYSNHLLVHSNYFETPQKRSTTIRALENQFQINFEQNLTGWIDNELALLITEPGSSSFENSSYACVKAKNIDFALQNLLQLQKAVDLKNTIPPLVAYRKHSLGYINLAGLVPLIYGNLFKQINNFYFTTIGSYVVIANQPSALKSFIDDYEDNKALTSDAAYKKMRQHSSGTSNFFLYVNLERSKNIFRHYASDDFIFNANQNKNDDNRFATFAFQLVNKKGNVETNMQLLKSKETINNANLLWTTPLDTSVSMTPYILDNPELKNKSIIVQDEANNLYKLDDAGNILWKRKLDGKIVSDIYAVDVRKNGQQQILFNTTTHLCLIDRNGNDYSNFPIRLPTNATNGCQVVDFENSKDYKIIVACSNKMVYAYEISGKPVTGWLFNHLIHDVVNPVQHFKSRNKDFLLIYNHHGNVFMLDKKGAVRNELTKCFLSTNNVFSFVPGDSTTEEHLVTTDTSGKIMNLFFNGTIKSTTYGIQTSNHAFLVSDFDANRKYDFAFLNKKQLAVFREDSSEIFSYAFKENGFPKLYSFSYTPTQHLIAVGSYTENKFFFLDGKGQLSNGFPVKGYRAAFTNEWGNDGKKILVTSGNDENVNAYIIN